MQWELLGLLHKPSDANGQLVHWVGRKGRVDQRQLQATPCCWCSTWWTQELKQWHVPRVHNVGIGVLHWPTNCLFYEGASPRARRELPAKVQGQILQQQRHDMGPISWRLQYCNRKLQRHLWRKARFYGNNWARSCTEGILFERPYCFCPSQAPCSIFMTSATNGADAFCFWYNASCRLFFEPICKWRHVEVKKPLEGYHAKAMS